MNVKGMWVQSPPTQAPGKKAASTNPRKNRVHRAPKKLVPNYENSRAGDADTNFVVKPGKKSNFEIQIFRRKVATVQTEVKPQITIHHGRYFDGFPK